MKNVFQFILTELPHSSPTLWTEHTKYDPGDILQANCSTPPSKPSATLTFLLNHNPVSFNFSSSSFYTYFFGNFTAVFFS